MSTAGPEARRVLVRLNPHRIWRWHLWLLDCLAAHPGTRIEVAFAADGRPYPAALTLLLDLERRLYRLGRGQAAALVPAADVACPRAERSPAADVTLDLSGLPAAAALPGRLVRPLYHGAATDEVLIASILAQDPVGLSFEGGGCDLQPAVDSPDVLTRALNGVFGTLLRACLQQIDDVGGDAVGAETSGTRPRARLAARPAALFAARALAGRLNDRLTRLCRRQTPRWRVGWRAAPLADSLGRTHRLPATGYRVLADDGRRYYADPFVLVADGRRTLFVEEFPLATGKGIISAAAIEDDGRIGTPRPVLEEPHHLSYPFVFAHQGEVWMIPESSGTRRVDLYRARRVPDAWEHAAVLIDGVSASDVTLTRQAGVWWMFAATHAWTSSSRDTLELFSAPGLFGPWTPHPRNPVLVDRRAARPGGAMFRMGKELWRPAQDSSKGYGSALSFCRVDALTPDAYRQTLVSTVHPGGSWPGRGLHTVNYAAGLETVDGLF